MVFLAMLFYCLYFQVVEDEEATVNEQATKAQAIRVFGAFLISKTNQFYGTGRKLSLSS